MLTKEGERDNDLMDASDEELDSIQTQEEAHKHTLEEGEDVRAYKGN